MPSFVCSVLPFLIWVMIVVNIQSIQLYVCHLLLARELLLCACHIGKAFPQNLSLDADIWSLKEAYPNTLVFQICLRFMYTQFNEIYKVIKKKIPLYSY